jgi:hypothetical protein
VDDDLTIKCATCGSDHVLSEISFGANAPAQWALLSETERLNSFLGSDQCEIKTAGETHYFVRACLDIPIVGTYKTYSWGVWVSLSVKSFQEMADHWEDPGRVALGPYFGWLCTPIPGYPDTMFLKTIVHQREPGLRPLVKLEPTEHSLAAHQRDGISVDELKRMLADLLHR